MTGRGGIDKWVEHELIKINRDLVTRRKKLGDLLKQEEPSCETREGDEYEFDRGALKRFSSVLQEGEDVLLPIAINFSSSVGNSCYISDETASILLRRLEGFGEAYPYREGKMWLPNSLAFAILQKYPTVFQGMFL